MSLDSTSLERESELNTIVKNNDFYEKKCEHFEKQQNSIATMLRQFEMGSSQVQRMASISEAKRREMKEEVEKQQRKTHSFVQDSMTLLNSEFEKVDAVRSGQRTLDLDNPALWITLPYDEWIEREEKKREKLILEMEAVRNSASTLKTDREELQRRSDVTSKAIGKAEKESNSLKEEIQRQELELANRQTTTAANQKKLQEATEEFAAEERKKAEVDEEIIAAEKVLNDLQTAEQKETEEEEKLRSKIDKLKSLHSKLAESVEFDPQLVAELPDHDEINKTADKWASFNSSRKDLVASLPELDVVVLETDTVESLQNTLEIVKKQVTDLQAEIEEVNNYKKKFVIAQELMSRKKSGYDAAVKQVEQNKTVLNKLKAKAAKMAEPPKPTKSKTDKQKEKEPLRQLEAPKMDIPRRPSRKTSAEDFRTPQNPAPIGRTIAQLIKQTSIGSDSTRPLNPNGPQYPGIQIFSQGQGQGAKSANVDPKPIISDENNVEEEQKSLDDTSVNLDVTGTTQDESIMDGFFSPHKNNTPIASDPPPVIEFSMADHMNEFNKRQAEKKGSGPGKPNRMVSERPFDDDEEHGAPEPEVEPIFLSDEDNDGIDDEDDDDLWASESVNLDQSAWGSDD